MRLALLVVLLAACRDDGDKFPDAAEVLPNGLVRAPRGGGYCCPIESGTCNCFRNGGWTASSQCPQICDLAPVDTYLVEDEHGCQTLYGPRSCLDPPP